MLTAYEQIVPFHDSIFLADSFLLSPIHRMIEWFRLDYFLAQISGKESCRKVISLYLM